MLDLEHSILFLFARRGQHIPWAPFHSPVQMYALILCPLGRAETSLSLPVSLHRHTEAAVADLPANHTNVNWCSTLAVTWVRQGCLQSSTATARPCICSTSDLLCLWGPHTTGALLRPHCQQPQALFGHLHQHKVSADSKGRQKIRGSVASWAINKHLH